MRYFFLLILFGGCDVINNARSFLYGSENNSISSSTGCSSECQQDCHEIFPTLGDFDRCTRLSDSTVRLIKRAVRNMERGIWNSITEDQISHIVSISYAPWIRYADGGTKSAENMLIWISENNRIPHYLDEDEEILKTVLDSLSSLSFDDGVRDAFSREIKDGRTFLEMMAWEKNDEGFRRVHKVILAVCDKDDICIRQTYCHNNSDIVPDTINKLELNLDFQDFDFACP